MNPTEQKNHKTALLTLENETTEALKSVAYQLDVIRVSVGEEHTQRLRLAAEQRGYVDARDRELRECCQQRWAATTETTKRLADDHVFFVRRGFWSRFNWLLTGR